MHALSNSDRQIITALKDLQRQWEEASSSWRDQARTDFEKEFIEELMPVAKASIAAIGEIDRLLKQAIHEGS